MKNLILLLLSIALLLPVSCGTNPKKADQSKEQDKAEVAATQPKTREVTYVIAGGVDMPSLFILTAVYTDASGKEARESITTLPWEKTISVTTPFNAMLDVERIPSVDYAVKEKYEVELHTAISYSSGNSSINTSTNTGTSKSTIGANKVIDFQKKFVERSFKKEEAVK